MAVSIADKTLLGRFDEIHARLRQASRKFRALLSVACLLPLFIWMIVVAAFPTESESPLLSVALLLTLGLAYIGVASLMTLKNFSTHGCGSLFYGQGAKVVVAEDEEYDTVQWIVLVWLPIFPLRSLRIRVLGGGATTLLGGYEYVKVSDLPCNHRLAFKTFVGGWALAASMLLVPVALVALYDWFQAWLKAGGGKTLNGVDPAIFLGLVAGSLFLFVLYFCGVAFGRLPAPKRLRRMVDACVTFSGRPVAIGTVSAKGFRFLGALTPLITILAVVLVPLIILLSYDVAHSWWYSDEIAEFKVLEGQLEQKVAAMKATEKEIEEQDATVAELDAQIELMRQNLKEITATAQRGMFPEPAYSHYVRTLNETNELIANRNAWAERRNGVREKANALIAEHNAMVSRANQLRPLVGTPNQWSVGAGRRGRIR